MEHEHPVLETPDTNEIIVNTPNNTPIFRSRFIDLCNPQNSTHPYAHMM